MTASRSQARALPPRERMVRSAAQLIRRKGVSGTGMREIVTEADAPRGSLQHYFPGGKEEIVSEALLKEYYLYYEHRSVSMIVSTYFHSFSTGSPKFNRTSFGGRNR